MSAAAPKEDWTDWVSDVLVNLIIAGFYWLSALICQRLFAPDWSLERCFAIVVSMQVAGCVSRGELRRRTGGLEAKLKVIGRMLGLPL